MYYIVTETYGYLYKRYLEKIYTWIAEGVLYVLANENYSETHLYASKG